MPLVHIEVVFIRFDIKKVRDESVYQWFHLLGVVYKNSHVILPYGSVTRVAGLRCDDTTGKRVTIQV